MQVLISYKEKISPALLYALDKLPGEIREGILSFISRCDIKRVNEIRIKKQGYISLIADSKNVITDVYISSKSLDYIVELLCQGSVYAHINTIREGYISIGYGIRAGICGQAIIENGSLCGITDISSINIRIPQLIENAGNYLFELLKKDGFSSSVLLFSPPGVGKTTILRGLIHKLSCSSIPLRASVIDTRNEITTCFFEELSCDVFLSYPKGKAIEIATRTMTPQIIICDEIATKDEAEAILLSTSSGVSFVATTHANSIDEVMNKKILKPLLSSHIFDYALGVRRGYGEKRYSYSLHELKC